MIGKTQFRNEPNAAIASLFPAFVAARNHTLPSASLMAISIPV